MENAEEKRIVKTVVKKKKVKKSKKKRLIGFIWQFKYIRKNALASVFLLLIGFKNVIDLRILINIFYI